MPSRLFYTDQHALPLPPGHKFPIEKYRLLRATLADDFSFILQPGPLADRESIELVHDPGYVDAFLRGALPDSAMRRIGFPWRRDWYSARSPRSVRL